MDKGRLWSWVTKLKAITILMRAYICMHTHTRAPMHTRMRAHTHTHMVAHKDMHSRSGRFGQNAPIRCTYTAQLHLTDHARPQKHVREQVQFKMADHMIRECPCGPPYTHTHTHLNSPKFAIINISVILHLPLPLCSYWSQVCCCL